MTTTPTDLGRHITETPLCDTHEHMLKEDPYLEQRPDILRNLFQNYVHGDFWSAGVSQEAMDGLVDPSNPDIRSRFEAVEETWKAIRHTGYGEAVQRSAKHLFGMEEITAGTLEAAAARNEELVQPGQRMEILRKTANLDHIQTDDGLRACPPDPSGPDFFFYDLSWRAFCCGTPELEILTEETGVEITDIAGLREAMARVFQDHAATAIAVKSQHAYQRTLAWQERSDGEAEQALQAYRRDPEGIGEEVRLCLGDWAWARGCELCAEHDLPFKIHTGYYAGNDRMPVDYIRAGNLCPLLARYPQTRFVLMHIAYPYNDELVALAKHYRNVYADLCWAWSIDPYSAADFVRRFIHAAPANKLFIFGGDTTFPAAAVGYALQARAWLARALQEEVADGLLSEGDAIDLATRLMRGNQYDCFRVRCKRAAVAAAGGEDQRVT